MNEDQFKKLEDYASRKLKKLPLASAPSDLVPNVLRLIAAAARPVGFWAWSMPLRVIMASFAILMALASVAGVQQLSNHAVATYSTSSVPALFSALSALGSGALLVIKNIGALVKPFANSPWLWLIAGSILATYLTLVSSAAVLIQLRKKYQTIL